MSDSIPDIENIEVKSSPLHNEEIHKEAKGYDVVAVINSATQPIEPLSTDYPNEDEEDTKDSETDDIDENEWLSADHPLLDRMQIALKKRLDRQLNRINTSVIQKEEDLKAIKKEREDIGVELYHRQQELASIQIKLECVNTKYKDVSTQRMQSESGLDELRNQHSSLTTHKKLQIKKENELRQELDALNESLRHIEEYEESVKTEIANQRRSAYCTEERMQELESAKIKQDLLMNHLEKSVSNLKSQIEIYCMELQIQQEETLSAKEILRESVHEMDNIKHEKREYVLKWKSSVIELNKRDDVLKHIENVSNEYEQQIRLKEVELIQYEKDINIEQENVDLQQTILNKISGDIEAIEAKITENIRIKQELQQTLEELKMKLAENETSLKYNRLEEHKYRENITVSEKKYGEIMREIHSIEEKIENNYSENMTLKHGKENTLTEIKKLRCTIHEKEFSVETVRNAIAKLKYEEITALQCISDLNEEYAQSQNKLKYNSDIIAEYEKEYKKGIDEMNKKTNALDRLNNKLEMLIRQKKEDGAALGTSPLEQSIHRLAKELNVAKVNVKN